MRREVWRALRQLAVAMLAVSAGGFASYLAPSLIDRGALIMLLGSVVCATVAGGAISGLMAVVLAIPLGALLLPPTMSLAIERAGDMLRFVVFVVVAAGLCSSYLLLERARAALSLSHRRMKAALESARSVAWDYRVGPGEFWWSPNFEAVFGRAQTASDRTQASLLGMVHPDDQRALQEALDMAKASHDPEACFQIRHRVIRSSGEVILVVTAGKLSRDGQGAGDRLTGITTILEPS